MKLWIWNDIFPDGHHTHVPSENDTNTIMNEIITPLTPGNIH